MMNLGNRLQKALAAFSYELIKQIINEAEALKFPVFLVGGIARDVILNRAAGDFDIVVEGDGIALAHKIARKYGGIVISHQRFGTAKWIISKTNYPFLQTVNRDTKNDIVDLPESIDIISARSETYDHSAALPRVARGTIKDDLSRRDFTINTLAIRLDGDHFGELIDFWNGFADIQNGIIRILHQKSFIDDPTRIFRAVRFEKRFAFHIEPGTLQLIPEGLPVLAHVSATRIRHELDLIFTEDDPSANLERLANLGVLQTIHSALLWKNNFREPLERAKKRQWQEISDIPSSFAQIPFSTGLAYLVWLQKLPESELIAISRRLNFPASLSASLHSAHILWTKLDELPLASNSSSTFSLEEYPTSAIAAVSCHTHKKEIAVLLDLYLTTWHALKPGLNGHTLKKMGIPQGPAYKSILKELRAAWLDGKISNADQEKEYLINQINKCGFN